MRKFIRHFCHKTNGSTAAEFALVLPLLILLLMAIIDVGRFMWTLNVGEKATQMGVRFAIVTEMVPDKLISYSFVIDHSPSIPAGTLLDDPALFGGATCTSTSCTCLGTCPILGHSSTAFNNILERIQKFMPAVAAENLQIDYLYSGLGYSGTPDGPDVAPLVRVRLVDLPEFQPILGAVFGLTIPLPDFSAALPMEDGMGINSN